MSRTQMFDRVIEQFTATDLGVKIVPPSSAKDDAFIHALRALEYFIRGEYEAMVDPIATALRLAKDPDERALTFAVAGLTIAGWPDAVSDSELRDPATGLDPLSAVDNTAQLSPELRAPILHLLAEAALACAQIERAVLFVERAGDVPDKLFGRQHPYLTVMRVLHVRVAVFRGEVATGRTLVGAAVDGAVTPVESMFANAVACLVDGTSDARRSAKDLADSIESDGIQPTGAVTRGCYLLAAYGLVAAGSLDRAAKFILAAGDGPGLERLMIIDRVLGLELLASSAIEGGDIGAAEAWLARAQPLWEHPIAESTVARIESRVAILAGDTDRALRFAEHAIQFARTHHRLIEAADGEIVLARARIAASRRGEAAQRLEHVVTDAVGQGHLSVRRSAARELREIGRRLRPAAFSGLPGLSAREVEVAERMAAGLSNGAIARELFLSEHTVRIHVSRVLHAFGVATRLGVARAIASTRPDATPGATATARPATLTARQRAIVDLIVAGATNSQIASELGIGVKTVEKHVSEVLRRWGAQSRVGIARVAMSEKNSH